MSDSTITDESNPFYGFEGRDGFHASTIKTGINSLALSVFAISGGEIRNFVSKDPMDATVELLKIDNPTQEDIGQLTRLELVMDAVARYFTTGGTWATLLQALHQSRKVISNGLVFKDYNLIGTYLIEDGNYEHLFVHKDGVNAVIWSESVKSDSGFPIGGWLLATTMDETKIRYADVVEFDTDDEEDDQDETTALQLPDNDIT